MACKRSPVRSRLAPPNFIFSQIRERESNLALAGFFVICQNKKLAMYLLLVFLYSVEANEAMYMTKRAVL